MELCYFRTLSLLTLVNKLLPLTWKLPTSEGQNRNFDTGTFNYIYLYIIIYYIYFIYKYNYISPFFREEQDNFMPARLGARQAELLQDHQQEEDLGRSHAGLCVLWGRPRIHQGRRNPGFPHHTSRGGARSGGHHSLGRGQQGCQSTHIRRVLRVSG